MTGKSMFGGGIALVTIVIATFVGVNNYRAEAEKKAKAEEANRVAATAYAANHPPVTRTVGNPVLQMPDRTTPCVIKIKEIHDLYTDGEPIYALPPGWPREKAVLYSGHGHMTLEGGNIHEGDWEFWSADNPKKSVLIRVFGK